MSKQKDPPLTYQDAVNIYFGGIQKLAMSSFPFKCKCGGEAWNEKDIYQHVRKAHKERIKTVKAIQRDAAKAVRAA